MLLDSFEHAEEDLARAQPVDRAGRGRAHPRRDARRVRDATPTLLEPTTSAPRRGRDARRSRRAMAGDDHLAIRARDRGARPRDQAVRAGAHEPRGRPAAASRALARSTRPSTARSESLMHDMPKIDVHEPAGPRLDRPADRRGQARHCRSSRQRRSAARASATPAAATSPARPATSTSRRASTRCREIDDKEDDIMDKAFDVRPESRLGCQAKVADEDRRRRDHRGDAARVARREPRRAQEAQGQRRLSAVYQLTTWSWYDGSQHMSVPLYAISTTRAGAACRPSAPELAGFVHRALIGDVPGRGRARSTSCAPSRIMQPVRLCLPVEADRAGARGVLRVHVGGVDLERVQRDELGQIVELREPAVGGGDPQVEPRVPPGAIDIASTSSTRSTVDRLDDRGRRGRARPSRRFG